MYTRILSLLCLLIPAFATAQLVGDTENGLASYYSTEYDGAETAYNVIYDKNQLVAAHRQFPFNSTVRVKNMENGKSVTVRIIDEGPFIRSRIIELSERAAGNIGLLGKETVPVELTLLSVPGQKDAIVIEEAPVINDPVVVPAQPAPTSPRDNTTPDPRTDPAPAAAPTVRPAAPVATAPTPAPVPADRSATNAGTTQAGPRPTVTSASRTVKATPVSNKTSTTRQTTFAPGVYKIEISDVPSGKFGVQVGSFNDLERAMDKVTEMQNKWFDDVLIERVKTGSTSTYKVILGIFDTDKSALRYAADLKKRYKIDGFTVEL